VGAAGIVDRGTDPSRVNAPLHTLVTLDVPAYQADACPMCAVGQAVVKPGSRA
jgi:orotate phosphoribosyltransferase